MLRLLPQFSWSCFGFVLFVVGLLYLFCSEDLREERLQYCPQGEKVSYESLSSDPEHTEITAFKRKNIT